MKRVLQMALKDLMLLSRDRIGMFFMLVFPIVMGIFFGYVMGGPSKGSKPTKSKVAVVDNDQSAISEQFTAALNKIDSLEVINAEHEEARNAVRKGDMVAMVVLPAGFGETAGIMWAEPPEIQVGLDPSRRATSAMLHGMIMQSMGELMGARFQDPDAMRGMLETSKKAIAEDESISPAMRPLLIALMSSFDSAFGTMEQMQGEGSDTNAGPMANGLQLANIETIDVVDKPKPGTQSVVKKIRSKWDLSFPQSMVWGVLSCVAGFTTLMVRERTLGTLTRLHVAPLPRWQILAGKGLGCFIAVMVVIALLVTVGTTLGMRPRSWPLLIMAASSTAFCFVGIMMMLSMFGKTEQAASGAAWGILTVLAMFGGGMIPIAFMPAPMAELSNFDPVKWSTLSIEGAIWRGFTFQEMLKPCGILIGVGVVTQAIGGWVVSRRES